MKQKINIIWCKKNLRVHDNEILANLNQEIPTLWVYFFEPKIMSLPDYSDFHLQFTLESLLDLQKNYLRLWIPLLLLPYDARQGFEKLEEYFVLETIYSHEETGNWETFQRDKNIVKYCKNSAINFVEYPTNGVVRRLGNRDNWNKIWMQRMSTHIFEAAQIQNTIEIPVELCDISKQTKQKYKKYLQTVGNEYFHSWKNRNDNNRSLQKNNIIWNPNLQTGWESEGLKILEKFLETHSAKYMYNISKPFESQSWCSRLSPYITYGCLSIKIIVQATENRRQELKELWSDAAKNHRKSLQYFMSRLHWQSHFIQKLEDEPEMEFRNLNRDFDAIRQTSDIELIEKVFSSQSGIPYIDALIKQLQQTGWCNFRSRAILVSFLCNTCLQPWKAIAPRVAALFTDYEPGIHYPQFQMQAGTTGINTIRIYNPVYNGKQKDPEGKFIYNYLPELKSVPIKHIHEPHLWEEFANLWYPEPIVDIKAANKVAKDLLWTTKGNILKSDKDKIVKKHASRVFTWDRRQNKKKSPEKKSKNENQIALFP